MKHTKKYIGLFFSLAILSASNTHYLYAANTTQKKEKSLFTKIKKSFTKLITLKWKKMDEDDWARIAFSCASAFGFYWFFIKKHASSTVPSASQDLFDSGWNQVNNNQRHNVRIRQIRVERQSGNTCAYHALRNGVEVLRMLDAGEPDENFSQLVNNQFGKRVIKSWQDCVVSRNKALNNHYSDVHKRQPANNRRVLNLLPESRENLHSAEIQYLINGIVPGINSNNFTIYDDSGVIGRAGFDNYIRAVRDNMRRNNIYRHVFIINTLDSSLDRKIRHTTNGHWYAVVLNQTMNAQGQLMREYIVMDSYRIYSMQPASSVWQLITALEE